MCEPIKRDYLAELADGVTAALCAVGRASVRVATWRMTVERMESARWWLLHRFLWELVALAVAAYFLTRWQLIAVLLASAGVSAWLAHGLHLELARRAEQPEPENLEPRAEVAEPEGRPDLRVVRSA